MVKYLNWAIEGIWLLAVLLIPLAFLPKGYAVSEAVIAFVEVPKIALLKALAGTGIILWLVEWGLVKKPDRWIVGPDRWIVGTVGLFLGVGILSTFLSDSFSVSLWGDIPGQDGYGLYIVLSYGGLFGLVAYHLRTERQVKRLLWAVVTVGVLSSLYGILQHFGWDPFGILEETGGGQTRVTSFMGNAIFFGSVLSMTIPATILLVVRNQRRSGKEILLLGILFGIQLVGIAFSLSRGPWIGVGVSIVTILLLGKLVFGWEVSRKLTRKSSLVLIGTILGLLVIGFFQFGVVFGRLTSTNSLVSREVNWSDSWRLVAERPWFDFSPSKPFWIQSLIGYGPDLLRPTYLLVSRPHTEAQLPMEPDHAHNYFLHQWVEQGIFGLLASVGLFLVPIGVGIRQLVRRRKELSDLQKLILIGMVGILFGRIFEQFVGVARVSDLTVFWILLGLLAAYPMIGWEREQTVQLSLVLPNLRLGIAVWLIGLILVLTWSRGLVYPLAAVQVGKAVKEASKGNLEGSTRLVDRSIGLVPDVPIYYNFRASVSGDMTQSYSFNREAVRYRPLYWRSRIALGNSAWLLGRREEAVRFYEQGASMVPSSYPIQNRLVRVYLDQGREREALGAIERSLAITGNSTNSEEAVSLLQETLQRIGKEKAGG